MHHIFFNHSSVDEHLPFFHFLAIVISATIDMRVQLSPQHTDFISLGYTPSSGIVRSYHSSIFNFF
uniref:Uncharacterized protein n=1 Tax=Marmota marmota marmota TaxID=9994 RepID=A0A8C5ZWZ1_MARMA